jgi:methylase of polypeptide subunit release factors
MSLNLEETVVYSPHEVFFCPEESRFYSQCLEKLFLTHYHSTDSIMEFGSGDGSPVIHCLLKTQFKGLIEGYELNPSACKLAQSSIRQYNLSRQYVVHNQCFFEALRHSKANYLIANPPYLPAPDNHIRMPSLHGGTDGAGITNQLLLEGCDHVLAMISAYSNPVDTIECAIAQGYKIVDFTISPLPFGYYSSEPKVKNNIADLRKHRKAFYSQNTYFLAGVLFAKQCYATLDLSAELIKVMTAL